MYEMLFTFTTNESITVIARIMKLRILGPVIKNWSLSRLVASSNHTHTLASLPMLILIRMDLYSYS